MTNYYNTISDPMYQKRLIDWYESEEMDQWLLYLWDGWKYFYDSKNIKYNEDELLNKKDYLDFAKKSFLKWKRNVFISLWCWNSDNEKYILENINDDYDVTYIWVDTSEYMLDESMKNLSHIDRKQIYLRADFGSDEFKNEINNICKDFDNKVFVFFWGTFWNIKYTKIINIMYNFLWKNDKIWIDIGIRKWHKVEDDLKLFEIYKWWLDNNRLSDFLLSKIRADGIDTSKWEVIVRSSESNEIWALEFNFLFKFKEKTKINIKNYDIIFLPGYSLKLLRIYRFWVDGFINLLEWHNFNLLEKQTKWYDGQFLFEKI